MLARRCTKLVTAALDCMEQCDQIIAKVINETDVMVDTGISDETLKQIRDEMEEGEEGKTLLKYAENGWPDEAKTVPLVVREWWKI